MEIRLSAEDRQRFGCPEWLPFRFDRLTAREAAVIQHETGLTPGELSSAIRYRIQIPGPPGVDWVDIEHARGEELPEGARFLTNYDAWAAVVWVALHRAKCGTSFEDAAEFDVFGLDTRADEGGDTDRGKDEGSSTPSTTSPD